MEAEWPRVSLEEDEELRKAKCSYIMGVQGMTG